MTDIAMDGYDYSLSGLSGVILEGGVTRHATDYGEGTAIAAVHELHDALARWIVAQRRFVTGDEHRFLRTLIGLSPEGMEGEIGGVEAPAVVAAEAEGNSLVPYALDDGIRTLVRLYRPEVSVARTRQDPAGTPIRMRHGATGWMLADAG